RSAAAVKLLSSATLRKTRRLSKVSIDHEPTGHAVRTQGTLMKYDDACICHGVGGRSLPSPPSTSPSGRRHRSAVQDSSAWPPTIFRKQPRGLDALPYSHLSSSPALARRSPISA